MTALTSLGYGWMEWCDPLGEGPICPLSFPPSRRKHECYRGSILRGVEDARSGI